jgi:2-methylcitrate dehydratase
LDQTLTTIVDFIMLTRKQPPPDAVLDRCREILVDTLGCAIGGRDCIAAQVARAFPASPEGEVGTVIGSARGAAIDIAAFWNTAMIRYLDFNDLVRGGHPSDMVGALIAMSRTVNASGEGMLTAIAIAHELFIRISKTVLTRQPWTFDQGYGVALGATGGICHLLGLSRDATAHAISFAATNGVPLRASRAGELSHYKGVATAVSSRHAVFCVHMARSGMTAPPAPFDGRHGIVELMNGKAGPLNLPAFNTWEVLQTALKYFPVAYNTQIGIWAALELRKQVNHTRLERITLHTSFFLRHESGSEPEKWDPKTRETADHSLPYIFSRALQDGTVNIHTFDLEKIRESEIRTLMNKVIIEGDAAIDAEWPGIIQARLDAVDRDGKTYRVHVRNPRGHHLNPMTAEEIENKFKQLTEPALGHDGAAFAFALAWRTREAGSFLSVLNAFVPTSAGSRK